MIKNVVVCLGVVWVLGVSAITGFAADKVDLSKLPPAAAKKDVTFEKDVRAIFEKACFKCHGPDVAKPKGKLRVDTRELVLKGGANGPNVVAGDIAKSQLLHVVAQLGSEDEWMPPPDNKDKIPMLTKEQVGLIRAWIEQGAK